MNQHLRGAISLAGLLLACDAQAADNELEIVYNGHCRECHSFVKDDNRLGPTLYGVVGSKAGAVPGFAFSESLKSSGVTWDEKTLDQWIADPGAVIPGNTMSPPYNGIQDAEIRKKIIAFLKQISPQDAGKSP